MSEPSVAPLGIDLGAWIAEAGAEAIGPVPETLDPALIITDSRALQPGCCFLPLVGERFDGHDYLAVAFEQGASLALCQRSYYRAHPELAGLALILVDDSLAAYQSLARHWRRRLAKPVIAITGSSGKTSTKEILAQVLAGFGRVHRSSANYNNEIGVPKTLLELRPEHDFALVEMGMRGLGQIAELCAAAEPDYGLITNVGPVHLSELGSMENIARAKWELGDWLQAHQGTLIINHDNAWLEGLGRTYTGKLVRCGHAAGDDLQLLATEPAAGGQTIRYRVGGAARSVWLDLEGEHQALNLLCCLGLLHSLGQALPDPHKISVPRLFGRQQRTEAGGLSLINDAYNANPDSMRAALQVLAQQPGRRIAVLGKMAELGPDADVFHRELGKVCEDLGLDAVYLVGPEARPLLDGLQRVPGHYFDSKQALVEALIAVLAPGDTVLFKASRSASLEEVADPVTQHFAKLAD